MLERQVLFCMTTLLLTAVAGAQTPQEVIARAEQKWDSVQTFQAKGTAKAFDGGGEPLSDPREIEVAYSRDGKLYYTRGEYDKVVSDGAFVYSQSHFLGRWSAWKKPYSPEEIAKHAVLPIDKLREFAPMLKECSDKGEDYVLTGGGLKDEKVVTCELKVRKKDYAVTQVYWESRSQSSRKTIIRLIEYEDITLDKKLRESLFEYTPPKGVEVKE